jgi:YD repeat-containing protein
VDASGNLATTTDTEGKTVTFGYDDWGRISKITTAEGRVTVFSYDDVNRVTSMLRATGFNASGSTGPTWTYAYTSDSATAAGTTTATDPESHATKYDHDGDGQVTEVTDALGHKRSTKFDANHNIDTATDAMGSGTTPGNATDYGFNTRNNLETVTLPTGGKTVNHWQTTAGGNDVPSDSTNPDGEKTQFTYDTAGNTMSVAQTGHRRRQRLLHLQPLLGDVWRLRGPALHPEDGDDLHEDGHHRLPLRRQGQPRHRHPAAAPDQDDLHLRRTRPHHDGDRRPRCHGHLHLRQPRPHQDRRHHQQGTGGVLLRR